MLFSSYQKLFVFLGPNENECLLVLVSSLFLLNQGNLD